MGQIIFIYLVVCMGLFQRERAAMAMKRLVNFKNEVTEGYSSVIME